MPSNKVAASFRDPSGFLFTTKGKLYRQVNKTYQHDYNLLFSSGLYASLTKSGWLIPHEEVDVKAPEADIAYKIIKPEKLDFISYPYEWSFSQLKDAALLTLKIQKRALKYGMTLKDSSAYNIQFHPKTGKPIMIDTLSFAKYEEGKPWDAYKQYCQHFLAPLALMHFTDIRLNQLSRVYIDGTPLDLASKLLPTKTKFNSAIQLHVHMHAKAQSKYADKEMGKDAIKGNISKQSLLGIIDSLNRATKKLTWQLANTEWGDYYDNTNYSESSLDFKGKLVKEFIEKSKAKSVWDLGGNNGKFSRIASQMGLQTISFDIDPSAVEQNYLQVKSAKDKNLVPLLLDLTNPSPNIGWQTDERTRIQDRGTPDAILALALIHHLAIANNVPLDRVAEYFSEIAPWLIIEFVPKGDSQVNRLLASREDIFPNYTFEGFEEAFSNFYSIKIKSDIENTKRKLYLLKRK
jgi:hypothetical protein